MSTTEIVVATPLDLALVERAEKLAERPRSEATARAYTFDWRTWEAFCSVHGLCPLPATESAIVAFLAHLQGEGRAPATIARAYATIRAKHLDADSPLPTLERVRNALTNIGRELGTASRGKTPLSAEHLKAIARAYDVEAEDPLRSAVDRTLAVRDTSMLLLGWAAARRREELVALDRPDVRFVEDGLHVQVRRSKTDQSGDGLAVGVAWGTKGTCPVRALRRWLDLSGIVEGALYRGVDRRGRVLPGRLSGEGVARAVQRAVGRIGLDPREYGGHSLRSGFATSAAEAGKSMASIMRQGGWESDKTVRTRYIRPASVFIDNASEGLL